VARNKAGCRYFIALEKLLQQPIEFPRGPLIIFDGCCGICTWTISCLASFSSHSLKAIPFQWLSDMQLNSLETTREFCSKEIHFIDQSGKLSTGAYAFNEMLLAAGFLSGLIEAIKSHSILLNIESRCYKWFASNRGKISFLLRTRRCALIDEV